MTTQQKAMYWAYMRREWVYLMMLRYPFNPSQFTHEQCVKMLRWNQ